MYITFLKILDRDFSSTRQQDFAGETWFCGVIKILLED